MNISGENNFNDLINHQQNFTNQQILKLFALEENEIYKDEIVNKFSIFLFNV